MPNFIFTLNAEGSHTSLDKVELERRFPRPASAPFLFQACCSDGARVGRQRVSVYPDFEHQRLHRPARGRTTRLLLWEQYLASARDSGFPPARIL
ncbi:hypothetical protein E2C01_030862 [Portunus trituberculatus]|uniref:Uncharacterized protein n=1 Tax=Portunus trituberculatus TaxID=210409 RepID=A0A5B7EWH2_PORTR|nr:hypothetical protein [Portunus trituberculatus]